MNCPICQKELIEGKFAICKYWECKTEVSIDWGNQVHYRKTSFNNGMINNKYIIPPFIISSDGYSCSITLLKDRGSFSGAYLSGVTIQKPEPLLIDDENKEIILNKLKIYSTFS